MNIGVHVPFSIRVFIFFRYIPKSWMAGSYGSSFFSLLTDLHTGFHNGCTDFHSHRWWMRVPSSPHPCQLLLFTVFLMIVILTDIRWYLIVVLICISLIISNVEHLFISVGHLCIFSEKMSIEVFGLVFNQVIIFLYWVIWTFIYFRYYPLICHIIYKYFLPFNTLYFHFVMVFFVMKKHF